MALTSVLAACSGHDMDEMGGMDMGSDAGATAPPVLDVRASPRPAEPAAAMDRDPASSVVEVTLEARVADVEIAPGRVLSLWTYDGQLPGPRIEANVGDRVRVRFRNSLPEATTIHWHGLRVPAAMDGSPVSQTPVPPGGELTYEFVVPDAGTFWYHPHVRSDEQVERGLYGAFVVRGEREPETTSERTVVLDDLLVDADWRFADFDPAHAMIGRQGNVILADGWARPEMEIPRGGLHRLRLVNAANARYFRLALPGHRLVQIGTDGGFLASPREVDHLLLVPGERADVLVMPDGDAGDALVWQSLRYDRGHGTGDLPDAPVLDWRLGEAAPGPSPAVPSSFPILTSLPGATTERELTLEESMSMGGGGHEGHGASSTGMATVFSINGQVYPAGTPLAATLDTVEQWSIVNTTEMDHPFHLHGFRFQVVTEDGTPEPLAWRDTVNVPAKETLTFRTRLEDHPGTWMFHCHILEHAERGMMGELEVSAP